MENTIETVRPEVEDHTQGGAEHASTLLEELRHNF